MLSSNSPAEVESNVPMNKLTISDDWDTPASTKSAMKEAEPEPLLKPNAHRFVLFPIQHHDFWMAYKNIEAKFWSAEEVELGDDSEGFESLSGKEKSFVMSVVALLAATDMIVPEPILQRFSDEIQSPEARCFFGFMMMQKNIHTELLTVLLDVFANTELERNDMLEAVCGLPSASAKSAWVQRFLTDCDDPLAMRIVSLAVYQYLFQTSAILSILLLGGPNFDPSKRLRRSEVVLPGLLEGTSKIIGDYTQYTYFCRLVKNNLVNTPPRSLVLAMVESAIQAEQQTMTDLFETMGGSVTLNGHTLVLEDAHRFIRFQAYQCLTMMGIDAPSKVKDDFPWISAIFIKANPGGAGKTIVQIKETPKKQQTPQSFEFSIDEDF